MVMFMIYFYQTRRFVLWFLLRYLTILISYVYLVYLLVCFTYHVTVNIERPLDPIDNVVIMVLLVLTVFLRF